MTKKKNKSYLRRKVRATFKRVDRDLGSRGNARMIHHGYNRGVTPKCYPRIMEI